MGGYAPAHYLKQFHPKYDGKDELDKKAKDAKSTPGPACSCSRTGHSTPICRSCLENRDADQHAQWVVERNPYIWVDTAGNQLPYIDKIV